MEFTRKELMAQMSISKRLGSFVKAVGDRLLPDHLYFRVFRPLFILGSKARRGSASQFELVEANLYRASDPDGTRLYFCERTRFRLYHYPKGVRGRIAQVAKKYSSAETKVEAGDVVIDVGANIGEFTVAVAPIASRVLAIDPDPNVQKALARNVKALENVALFQLALSDEDGNVEFFLSTKDADSSLVPPQVYSGVTKVRACRLDTFIEEAGIKSVDFLKVEAEGWEPEILSGAVRTLNVTRKVVVDSGPERQGMPTTEAVEKILLDAGFMVFHRGYMVFASRSRLGS